ncbi:HEPN domain-containing protein [Algoriphagus sp. D3-2-R+10]|uniref:HEPN domain-containing protein n=1 Tax=Algoriphagus aurantiacus TaxID=3103948 RepID=UPI002B3DB9D6|nr:HEPN domain-containing protein [Algoriphagus sp. D3-2-R+10]MEB2774618.1 HEPN domain-containing protein [Algoriphagus sp. D3-2-R+10]
MGIQLLRSDQDRVAHFKGFLEQLVEKFQPVRIISFGKQTIQNEIVGCFGSKQLVHQHYCLLMVTESPTRIDYEVQDFTTKHYHNGQITIVCHGETSINDAIQSDSRFFITVLSQGQLLYSKDGFSTFDSVPALNPIKALEKAEQSFFHRMPMAEGFLDCAHGCLSRQNSNICTFLMHQAVEQSCIVLIRVYTGYRSEFHNLSRLLGFIRCFSDDPYDLLVGGNPLERKLFDILIKSYSQARYAPSFTIEQKDAEQLFVKVSSFVQLIKTMCVNKMEDLANEVQQFKINHEIEGNYE